MPRLPFDLRTEDLVRIAHEGYREGEPPIAYTTWVTGASRDAVSRHLRKARERGLPVPPTPAGRPSRKRKS